MTLTKSHRKTHFRLYSKRGDTERDRDGEMEGRGEAGKRTNTALCYRRFSLGNKRKVAHKLSESLTQVCDGHSSGSQPKHMTP